MIANKRNLPHLLENGKYPAFAFPGGYTIIYIDEHGEIECAECASPTWPINATPWGKPKIIDYDTYDEGPTLQCSECGVEIESSYGDPEEENDQ